MDTNGQNENVENVTKKVDTKTIVAGVILVVLIIVAIVASI